MAQEKLNRITMSLQSVRINARTRQEEGRAEKGLRIYERIEHTCPESKLNNLDVVFLVDAIWDLVDHTAGDPSALQLLPLITFMRTCGSHVYAD